MENRTKIYGTWDRMENICQHVWLERDPPTGDAVDCRLSIEDTVDSCEVWATKWYLGSQENGGCGSRTLTYDHCCTWFRIDFRYYEGVGWARFMNRLRVLGKPGYDKWRSGFGGW